MYRGKTPLRKVTGELNPEWCNFQHIIVSPLSSLSVPELVDEMKGLGSFFESRQETGQALIDEEERIIDEFCGLPPKNEHTKWAPQYPLDTANFTEGTYYAKLTDALVRDRLHPLARKFLGNEVWFG